MTVDFRIKHVPEYTVACVTEEGVYSDRAIRLSFEKAAKWAAARSLRTGKWFFVELNEEGDRLKWSACVELKGQAKGAEGVSVTKFRASDAVSVTFDPRLVSAGIVYHAINDWVRWRKKDGTIARTGSYREVYSGNPWKQPDAWKKTEVQLLVSKGERPGKEP